MVEVPDDRLFSTEDVEKIAERAAQKAVHDTLLMLGINTKNAKEVMEFKETLIYSNDLRKRAQGTVKIAFTAFVTAAVTLAVTWLSNNWWRGS